MTDDATEPELPAVEEDTAETIRGSDSGEDNDLHRSPSVASPVSGVTTFHIEHLRSNAGLLLQNLTSLIDTSETIMTKLRRKFRHRGEDLDLAKVLLAAESDLKRLFEKFLGLFQPYSEDNYWSNAGHVLRALLPDATDAGSKSFEAQLNHVLHYANLVKLINDIFSLKDHDENLHLKMAAIETTFPQPFLLSSCRSEKSNIFGSSQLIHETLDVLVLLRTQLFIAIMKSQVADKTHPDDLLQTTVLKSWDKDNFPKTVSSDVGVFEEKKIVRAKEIRSCYREDDASLNAGDFIDFERLDSQFSWASFVADVARWAGQRAHEIKMQPDCDGEISELAETLQEQIFQAYSAQQNREFTSSDVSKDKKLAILRNGRRPINNHSNRNTTELAASKAASDRTPNLEMLGSHETLPDKENQPLVGTRKSAKRFIDPQINAARIPFDSQETEVLPTNQVSVVIDSSQTDAFQQDLRSVGNSKRRMHSAEVSTTSKKREAGPRSPQSAQSQPPSKRSRKARSDGDGDAPYLPPKQHQEDDEADEKSLQDVESDNNDDERRSSPVKDAAKRQLSNATKEKNEKKRALAEVLHANKVARRGERIPWAIEENDALIDAICAHGCKWSRIKELDRAGENVLEKRDQGDLKDRARNIKYELLSKGATMPENFESIALPRSQRDRLERLGIPDPLPCG